MSRARADGELPPHYNPAASDPLLYERWERSRVFEADASRSTRTGGDRRTFTVVMPPPNVTAVLHMGHGLNNTVQDVVVRWRRMRGDETLWLPGTDHAGIATQNVVERALAAEGKTRFDLGRENFFQRTKEFVEKTGGAILQQLRAIGASADWSRTAYTLSPELSDAVRNAFVHLYERGLIYRGHRVIHWCPRCLTSLSDEEAEHEEEDGRLYFVRYPLVSAKGGTRHITVATTRPETMLGDVAVVVNPDDERYASLVGAKLELPLAGVQIPVIADASVDATFGTGAVKVTPAHDSNDFDIGVRHHLPAPIVMDEHARMGASGEAAGRVPETLDGMDRLAARARIVEMLRDKGLLEKIEPHRHAIRHCYRCDTIVEPRLSDQWFVRMRPLAEPALQGVRDGTIRILPDRWEAVYVNWLENIRDWNISRQLWWGHRIPVWYCAKCEAPIVSRMNIASCPTCGGEVRQDEDVLDTWFSSWLWPLSTLGWPDPAARDLRAFYPTDTLISSPDILFFWIARMVMAGYEFMGAAPFHTVYLHGVVRDTQHRKMSKMLGNGIDPLDVVSLYGADALRYTVIAGLGMGTDSILDPGDLDKSFSPGRNFVTKLWNIGRYLLTNLGDAGVSPLSAITDADMLPADRWILARLDVAVEACDAALGPARPGARGKWTAEERRAGFRLNEYLEAARAFVWNDLADWYLESVKPRLAGEAPGGDTARAVLVHVTDAALRLLHPVVPFITEDIWQRLPQSGTRDSDFLARAAWPAASGRGAAPEFEAARDAVTAIRQIRAEYAIPPGTTLDVRIVAPLKGTLAAQTELIGRLSKATVGVTARPEAGAAAHALLADGSEVVVPLEGVVDVERECEKLRGELVELVKHLASLEGRLSNEKFVSRAPPEVVEAEREKQRDWTSRRAQLERKVSALCGN